MVRAGERSRDRIICRIYGAVGGLWMASKRSAAAGHSRRALPTTWPSSFDTGAPPLSRWHSYQMRSMRSASPRAIRMSAPVARPPSRLPTNSASPRPIKIRPSVEAWRCFSIVGA
jgi:hypothetical protein